MSEGHRTNGAAGSPVNVVLLVDDHPHALRALERVLRADYEAADEAVRHVKSGGVSVVVSDIAIPT